MLLERNNYILPELEKLRQEKTIGKSLDASVLIEASGNSFGVLDGHAEELRELVNVSQLKIEPPAKDWGGNMRRTFRKADGQKCERCWHWETDIGQNAEHPTICGRCIEAVKSYKA